MADAMDEREVEAVARALHKQFWIRTYGAETGTATHVMAITWDCVTVARMDDARAAILELDRLRGGTEG